MKLQTAITVAENTLRGAFPQAVHVLAEEHPYAMIRCAARIVRRGLTILASELEMRRARAELRSGAADRD